MDLGTLPGTPFTFPTFPPSDTTCPTAKTSNV